MELELYSVSDLARILNAKTSSVNYIILKHRIDQDGLIANRVKVYRREKLNLIKELIEKTRKHRRKQDVARIGW